MRAAVLREYGVLPSVEEFPVPEPGPGEALLRVEKVGLCATDLKLINGALPPTGLPRIPGHEIAGTVVRCDDQPEWVGKRVACNLYETCGKCRACLSGFESLCASGRRAGVERDGGLAEWVAVSNQVLLEIGDNTDFELAAVAMDAVASPWAGLHDKGGLKSGEFVVVVGCGGLGSNAVQIAKAAGARVAVIDPIEGHRSLGLELGAELAVGPDQTDELIAWSDGGAHLGLETSGKRAGFDLAVETLAPGGRIVCNGYQPSTEYGLDSTRLVLQEVSVIGSRAANKEVSRAALAAVERGEVKPRIMDVMPLSKAREALQLLSEGKVEGRLILDPTSGD